MSDDISCPSHYCEGRKYEPRKVAEDWGLDKDAYLFNAFKYIARAGRKPFEGSLQMGMYKDLMKAREYIDFRLEVLVRELEQELSEPGTECSTHEDKGLDEGCMIDWPEGEGDY